jgi:hypothetical protein
MRREHSFLVLGLTVATLCASVGPALSNIVSYANVTFTNGYNFIANPLDAAVTGTNVSNANSLTNIIPSPPDQTMVFVWDVTNQVFLPPATYDASAFPPAWDLNFDLPPGKGFVVLANALWTNTFVGNVEQGSLTNFVAGTNKFSLLANKVPLAESLRIMGLTGSNSALFATTDGQNVYTFRTPSQSYSDAFTWFGGYGWFDPDGVVDTNGPVIAIAQSFFIQNPGPDAYWIRSFIVPSASAAPSPLAVSSSTEPTIRRLSASGGWITLEIANARKAYDVQFSSDGRKWKTVARNRTGILWSQPHPGGTQGYYRLVTP